MVHQYTLSTRDSSLLWPRVPSGDAAAAVALHAELAQSQWLSAENLLARQLDQSRSLLAHALKTVPYYRERLQGLIDTDIPLDLDRWRMLPILTRLDLQDHEDSLASEAPPRSHGQVSTVQSSGSTGTPVRVKSSAVCSLFYYANNLRHYRWHEYDSAARYAGITRLRPKQQKLADLRTPVPWMMGYETGPFYYFDIGNTVSDQAAWLQEIRPQFLTTYPSNIKHLVEQGIELPKLDGITTMSEVLDPDARATCEAALGAQLHDIYSAQELGIIALQCPSGPVYHTMGESVFVEVLNDAGTPCEPGEVGRLIVTPLMNFAMPLIRYEVGDLAEVAEPCRCGRGLSTIRRILGRVRNMLVLPNGQKVRPSFGSRGLTAIAPIRQHQIIQKSVTHLEARLVTARPLTVAEEEKLARHISARVPAEMTVTFTYHEDIPRSPSGKFEDFMSEVDG